MKGDLLTIFKTKLCSKKDINLFLYNSLEIHTAYVLDSGSWLLTPEQLFHYKDMLQQVAEKGGFWPNLLIVFLFWRGYLF